MTTPPRRAVLTVPAPEEQPTKGSAGDSLSLSKRFPRDANKLSRESSSRKGCAALDTRRMSCKITANPDASLLLPLCLGGRKWRHSKDSLPFPQPGLPLGYCEADCCCQVKPGQKPARSRAPSVRRKQRDTSDTLGWTDPFSK